MQKLLQFILENIVENPKDVSINQYENEYGTLVLEANVNPEDMGKVIGKQGKIISAIRKILKVKAIKINQRFQFNLLDQQQTD
jgi:uncharacterized protein